MVVDRQKVKTRSESRRYRVAGRLEVRAGRLDRQAGTESRKQAKVKNRGDYQKRIEAKTLVDLKGTQDELVQRDRKHRDK